MRVIAFAEKEKVCGLLARRTSGSWEAKEKVAAILRAVRAEGDKAVREYTRVFDGVELAELEVSGRELRAAGEEAGEEVITALKRMKKNLERVARAQKPRDVSVKLPWGEVGVRWTPIERVGVYAPGGRAAYPSTVLMACVPAQVAGVKEIILCTPPQKDGRASPLVLAAAQVCGVRRVFKIGGAQAIAAMAFGTKSVPRANKIVGPGNVFVTTAKMMARSESTDIDVPAGPSEVFVIADERADAEVIALELLAQAEHDPSAAAILATPSRRLAERVNAALERALEGFPREDIARAALEKNSAIVVGSLDKAVAFANEWAPEHLEIIAENAEGIARKVKNAGSIFIGPFSAVPFGDYNAGSNHILPTSGAARVFSGVGVWSFLKASYTTRMTRNGAGMLARDAALLARKEGFEGHARAMERRLR
ncbi:MAG: histidinol dehydrogenase [Candidatus Micrarchaeia archaeon]